MARYRIITELKFSKGWLHKFKKIFNLKVHTLHGEAASMNDVDVQSHRKGLAAKLCDIDPETTLNMDKNGLLFKHSQQKQISANEKKGIK